MSEYRPSQILIGLIVGTICGLALSVMFLAHESADHNNRLDRIERKIEEGK